MEKGNELAYTPAGKPIIWNGKHLTFAEFVIMSWLSDKKFMHEWRDVAVGKVPLPVDVTSKGESIIQKVTDEEYNRTLSSLALALDEISLGEAIPGAGGKADGGLDSTKS